MFFEKKKNTRFLLLKLLIVPFAGTLPGQPVLL